VLQLELVRFKAGGSQNVFKILPALFVEISTCLSNFTLNSELPCRVLTMPFVTGTF
jgi:hypothetical protein